MDHPVPESGKIQLHNGVHMPLLGLGKLEHFDFSNLFRPKIGIEMTNGTSHNGGYSQEAVVYALKECNYRLIDTAKRYGCEERLGQAIKESGVPREEIFLTTKIWPTDYGPLTTRQAFLGSMKRLDVDYIDLYMLHAPNLPSSCKRKRFTMETTWRELEMLFDAKLVRAIGVSNYTVYQLEQMMEFCCIKPHVNQVEFHPYQNPRRLHKFCTENGIALEGYCPLAKGSILNDEPIQCIARRVGRTPAQVLIRWSIQNNVVTIPKSTNPSRVLENSQVFDFSLSEADMATLNQLHDGRRIVDLDGMQDKIDNPLPDGYKLNLPQTNPSCLRRTS